MHFRQVGAAGSQRHHGISSSSLIRPCWKFCVIFFIWFTPDAVKQRVGILLAGRAGSYLTDFAAGRVCLRGFQREVQRWPYTAL